MLSDFLQTIWSDSNSKKILLFLILNVSFMGVELLYGYLSNSLGLIGDSFHMLCDSMALMIGLGASYISKLSADASQQKSKNILQKYTYGLAKVETLSGLLNSIFLIVVSYNLFVKSLDRIYNP